MRIQAIDTADTLRQQQQKNGGIVFLLAHDVFLFPSLRCGCAERWCREQLKREDIVIEITVMSHREDLFRWYESQGYKMGGKIPFPLPDIVKDGIHVELQLMTKKIP